MRRLTAPLARAALWLLLPLAFVLATTRLWLVPMLDDYREHFAQHLSATLHLPVHIHQLQARWHGWRPRLRLREVTLGAPDAPLLHLPEVQAELSWRSLLVAQPVFAHLRVRAPSLRFARLHDGSFELLGQRITPQGGGEENPFLVWLAEQRNITIQDARLHLQDAIGQQDVQLEHVSLRWQGGQTPWRFALRAAPPQALAESVEVRGEFAPDNAARLYLDLQGAHFLAIRDFARRSLPDLDLPASVAGNGALRLWLAFANEGGIVPQAAEFDIHHPRWQPTHAADAPAGQAERLHGSLRFEDAQHWQASLDLRDLSMQPHGAIPGLHHADVRLHGNAARGAASLSLHGGHLALPKVFPAREGQLAFQTLDAALRWQRQPDGSLHLTLHEARFANADAQGGEAEGTLTLPADGSSARIDLSARLAQADGAATWRYLPHVVPEAARNWLHNYLTAGTAREVTLTLRGALADFPFAHDEGEFSIAMHAEGVRLRPYEDWPEMHDIRGRLRFHGAGMFIEEAEGRLYGVQLAPVAAQIADLGADSPHLVLAGDARGETGEFLRFIRESPVRERVADWVTMLTPTGEAGLRLALDIALDTPEQSQAQGEFQFVDNRVQLPPWPAIEAARLRLRFTLEELAIDEIGGQWLGHPLQLTSENTQAGPTLSGQLLFDADALRQQLAQNPNAPAALLGAMNALRGQTPVQLHAQLHKGRDEIQLTSNLTGLASTAPAPLAKAGDAVWPMQFALRHTPERLHLDWELPSRLHGAIRWQATPQGDDWHLAQGALGVFTAAPLPAQGLAVEANLPDINFDDWRTFLQQTGADSGASSRARAPLCPPCTVRLRAERFQLFDTPARALNLQLDALPARGWQGHVDSTLAAGPVQWLDEGAHGLLRARLKHFAIGEAPLPPEKQVITVTAEGGRPTAPEPADPARTHLPDVDLIVDQLYLNGQPLGRLALQAANNEHGWQLSRAELINEDATLTASGEWGAHAPSRTRTRFSLALRDIGRFLARLNQPDVLAGGTGALAGQLDWPGSPLQFFRGALDGAGELNAANSSFRTIEPGMGRLLSVFSLQSIPRRLTGDFQDVFGQGFAFDAASAHFRLENGILRTDDLHIHGPSASILITGEADLQAQTQELTATITPSVATPVAAAAGLAFPPAAIAAYIAQKALNDPVSRALTSRYRIFGHWANPEVERLAASAPAANEEKETHAP